MCFNKSCRDAEIPPFMQWFFLLKEYFEKASNILGVVEKLFFFGGPVVAVDRTLINYFKEFIFPLRKTSQKY